MDKITYNSKVELVDFMGSDLTVVNAARVSFSKESSWEEIPFNDFSEVKVLKEKDEKLIRYLAKHGHWTPFGHASLSFRIKAPVFVARQLVKHQVGLVWNEVSRRYVTSEPEFWRADKWRKQSKDKKQVSDTEEITYPVTASDVYVHAVLACMHAYNTLLDLGVCAEQARTILPQSAFTEWYWTGSLYAFSRVFRLRADKLAQPETGEVAVAIGEIASKLFPVSWKTLTEDAQ